LGGVRASGTKVSGGVDPYGGTRPVPGKYKEESSGGLLGEVSPAITIAGPC